MRQAFFATCAPGVEPVLHAEARALGLAKVERQVGGVYFEGMLADAWRANLRLRTAVRVLLRVARFPAPDEAALYAGAKEVDWSRFLGEDGTLRVDAHASESALAHTLFVEQRVKDAVADRMRERAGRRPSVDKEDPDLAIHVHLFRDRCTLLADTSGESLHKRGWRRHQGRAPLAETLAAAVVALSEWDRRSPLLDPFCGSGTIAVEAALLAGGVAPGLFRERFGFERWQGHDAAGWTRMREQARAEIVLPKKLIVRGSDVDRAQVEGARANLAAAGLDGVVEIEEQDALELAPRRGWNAWVVSNLPYGQRIGAEPELLDLHRRFGALLRERCAGYRVALLTGAPALARALGIAPEREVDLENGGLSCRLVCASIG